MLRSQSRAIHIDTVTGNSFTRTRTPGRISTSDGSAVLVWHDQLAGRRALPNTRLKLAAPVLEGRIAFVIRTARRRSLGAFR